MLNIKDLQEQFTIQGKVKIKAYGYGFDSPNGQEQFDDFEYKSYQSILRNCEIAYMYVEDGYLTIEVYKED